MRISDCTFDGSDPCSCDCDECAIAREFGDVDALADELADYTALDCLRDDACAMGY